MFKPQTEKKYQVSGSMLTLYISKKRSRYWEPSLVRSRSYWSPSMPAPLKSVAGSLPWNPISTHSIDFLFFNSTPGLKFTHNYISLASCLLSPTLNSKLENAWIWFRLSRNRISLDICLKNTCLLSLSKLSKKNLLLPNDRWVSWMTSSMSRSLCCRNHFARNLTSLRKNTRKEWSKVGFFRRAWRVVGEDIES